MRLHPFNRDKALRKLRWKQYQGKYIKIGTILLSMGILVIGIIYYSYSKYSVTKKLDVIQTKVGEFTTGDFTVAAYVNGTKASTFPTKDDGYGVVKIECTNGATATWNTTDWTITIGNNTSSTKCTVYFNDVYTFDYTGAVQTFTASKDGYYQFEAWGAQGGAGGLGGYESGIMLLTKDTSFQIVVGGVGTVGTTSRGGGGYNGGGNGQIYTASAQNKYGGGGSTDVRSGDHTLYDRIMVAAGGGGMADGYSNSPYMVAGGLTGYAGSVYSSGKGGTQIAGGAGYTSTTYGSSQAGGFGYGGYGNSHGSGGGSGLYGGGGGARDGSDGSGGGGSSFISGHQGCVAISSSTSLTPRLDVNSVECTETSAATDITCSYHYSNYKFTNTKMIDGAGYEWTTVVGTTVVGMPTHDGSSTMTGNTGNGYAKITYLGTSIE